MPYNANQIVRQIKASIPEQYQPKNKRAVRILDDDIKKQVLSQHLAVQLSHYADQPSDGKKHLGRVVISGGTSLLFRVPGCRISRDLDIITSIKRDKMTRLLEETLSQDKDDPFTYKILKARKTKSRNGDTYVIQVLDGDKEYVQIKMDAIRGVPEEYDDTEALTVQDPLISSRASTTIKLIDPGKYIAGKIAALFPLNDQREDTSRWKNLRNLGDLAIGKYRETSRWKDLGDLMIMASHLPISPDTIQRGLKYMENLHNPLNKIFGHRPDSNWPYTQMFLTPKELKELEGAAQQNEDIVADRVRPPQGEKPEDTRKRKGFEQRQLIQHCSVVHSLEKVFGRVSRWLDPCFHHMEPHRRENTYRKELRTFARSPQMWVPGDEEAGLGVWDNKSRVGDLPEKLREMRGDYVLGGGFVNGVTVGDVLSEEYKKSRKSPEEEKKKGAQESSGQSSSEKTTYDEDDYEVFDNPDENDDGESYGDGDDPFGNPDDNDDDNDQGKQL